MIRQGIALRPGSVELLYHVPYSALRFNKVREPETFYITPRYVPGVRGMLLVYDMSEFVIVGEQFIKNGVVYRLFLPLKRPL